MKQKKEKFVKYDQGKLRYDLMPQKVLEQVVDVLTYGANKYSPDNWKNCPEPDKRYYSALMRHVEKHRSGEFLDKESGKPHLAHAICCLTFMLESANMKK